MSSVVEYIDVVMDHFQATVDDKIKTALHTTTSPSTTTACFTPISQNNMAPTITTPPHQNNMVLPGNMITHHHKIAMPSATVTTTSSHQNNISVAVTRWVSSAGLDGRATV